MSLSRRFVVFSAPLVLAACSGLDFSQAGVTLNQVKEYTDDVVDALSAGASAYLQNHVNPSISALISNLQQARQAVDAAVTPADARQAVLEAITFIQSIAPIVEPFMGVAGPYVPIAVAVLQAFFSGLPRPSDAPPSPPAQLKHAAIHYRSHLPLNAH